MNDTKSIDWLEILETIQKFATSGAARQTLAELRPLPNETLAIRSVDEIFSAQELIHQGHRPSLASLDLFEPWHSRLRRKAVLKNLELKDVRNFCLEALALSEALRPLPSAWAKQALEQLMDASEPLSAIDQILTPGGEIRSDASETLFRLFKEKENLSRQVQSHLDRLVKAHEMEANLQDRFVTTREGRWVLPIRSGMQHFVPGVIHGSSQTKQTVFMEPEVVVPLNNRLRQVEVEIEDEIEHLLTELSNYLATLCEPFTQARTLMQQMDCTLAKAQWNELMQGQRFEFSQAELDLRVLAHPLMQIAIKKPIQNHVHLDTEKSILLLSGPNAGGKTVLLKAVGLAA